MTRTILVICPGGLGDAILALPAIRALRKAYPEHACGILVSRGLGELYRLCGEVDRSFSLESSCLAQLFAGPESVAPDFRDWLVRCDVAVCWMNDAAGLVMSTLQALGVRQVIIQSPRALDHESVHQSECLLGTLRSLVKSDDKDMTLRLPSDVVHSAREWLRVTGVRDVLRIVVLHPGSGSRHKCCEPAVLAKTVELLQVRGMIPILLEGPADEGIVTQVCSHLSKPVIVLRHLDLLTLAVVLAQVKLYIGHDSGVTHLAAVLATPTIALFGPTDVRRWAPRGPNVRVLTGDTCQCRTWEAVQRCVQKSCLGISAERILTACEKMLHPIVSVAGRSTLPCHAS